jgi:hypothetical protein
MSVPIFRPEAVAARSHSWLGEIHIEKPRSHVLMTVLAVVAFGAIAFVIVVGSYSRFVSVNGITMPAVTPTPVVTNANGTVIAVLVTEGAEVHNGDPIALVSSVGPNDTSKNGEAPRVLTPAVVLRSPATGSVLSVNIHPGESVTASMIALRVLPPFAPPAGILFLPPQAAEALRVNDQLLVRYGPPPVEHERIITARVVAISYNVLAPGQLAALGGTQTRDPMLRVDLEFAKPTNNETAGVGPLKSFMPLATDIVIEHKPIRELILPFASIEPHRQIR